MEKLSKGELIFVGIIVFGVIIALPFIFGLKNIKDIIIEIVIAIGLISAFMQLIKQSKPDYVDTRSNSRKKITGIYFGVKSIIFLIVSILILIVGIYLTITGKNYWWLGLIVILVGVLFGILARNIWKITKETHLS